MRIEGTMLALAVLVASRAGAAADKKPADDAKRLEGTWSVVSIEPVGPKGDDLKKAKLVIKGDKLTLFIEAKEEDATFKIDPTHKPKHIDISPGKGELLKGIFELDGDNLKLCFAKENEPRPTKFATDLTKKPSPLLMVLKRQK